MAISIIDYILPEDRELYTQIIERAAEAKANAPKAERKPRAPMTDAQKAKQVESRIEKLKARLALLQAGSNENTDEE